ncbi:MAG: hypothetical protein OXH96_20170 [Spirochaetaceae bacterium]|nr:hypothetical protein [Spirochaetaceae bacterium]
MNYDKPPERSSLVGRARLHGAEDALRRNVEQRVRSNRSPGIDIRASTKRFFLASLW